MSMMAWARVGATLSAAYDSVSAVVSTAAKFCAAVGTMAVTLDFIVAVRSPEVAAFVRFVTVVIVPAVMLVGVAKPDWICTTVGAAAVTAVATLVFMVCVRSPDVGAFVRFVTVVIVPAVMLVGVARPD